MQFMIFRYESDIVHNSFHELESVKLTPAHVCTQFVIMITELLRQSQVGRNLYLMYLSVASIFFIVNLILFLPATVCFDRSLVNTRILEKQTFENCKVCPNFQFDLGGVPN